MAEMNIIHEDRPSQFFVLSDGNNYQLKWDDSRLAPHIKEIEKEDFEEYLAGKRTGGDLMFKAAYGTWPLPQEEQEKAERNFIRETPTALISDSTAISLFSKEELEQLIPIAEQQWIDWKGELPENYQSPLT
ncbi:hypothetical protein Hs30E_19920 [Lactococcus hodotermopsidis]|uniref:Uncharacterized protein n=1 Tax=Pseudolactococcus hodotermopsidis TaxID=2709157 RepID=A0A6A0BGP4_9LACT|nr:hypothetical protein [Lactococcus hodotermopsidis]GFH43441.1 hypothetical protein Hs30E_19920 [Lactococcus hodotermopsidis]